MSSSTFKYLDSTESESNDDAAQSFLNEKLSKNRYTPQQQEALDASGGSKKFGGDTAQLNSNKKN